MIYLKYIGLAVISFFFTFLAMVLAPVLPLFADGKGWLPHWLWWFQTDDNNLDGDLNGWTTVPVGSYWRRVLWLWRNPAYGFDFNVLAILLPPGCSITWTGDVNVRNRPQGKVGRLFVWVTAPDGRRWFHFRKIVPAWNGECWDFNFGWRLQTYAEQPDTIKPGGVASFVCTIRPTPFKA